MCCVIIYGFILTGNGVKKSSCYISVICAFFPPNYLTEISNTHLEHFVIMSLCAICLEISFNINVHNMFIHKLCCMESSTCGKNKIIDSVAIFVHNLIICGHVNLF